MNKKKYKILLNIFGYLVVIICFIFIYQTFKNIDFSVIKDRINYFWILNIIIFAFIYSILFQFQGITWNIIVEVISERKNNLLEILSIYSTANIAKYIPGNIFVFVARHIILRRYGISDIRLILINLTEMACFFGMSIFVSMLGVISGIIKIPDYIFNNINIYFLIIGSIVVLIFLLVLFIIYNKRAIKEFIKILNFKNIIKMSSNLTLYFLYFVLYGLLNAYIFKVFLHIDISFNDIIVIISIFTISWVLGYIVPGASGGIGVRESILIILLSSYFDKPEVLVFVVLSRIITLLGEILSFVYARVYKVYFNIKFKEKKVI
jgi:uncharacterized membrane protein YbhN (UPF0104 family)